VNNKLLVTNWSLVSKFPQTSLPGTVFHCYCFFKWFAWAFLISHLRVPGADPAGKFRRGAISVICGSHVSFAGSLL